MFFVCMIFKNCWSVLWKHFTCTVREVISVHFNVHFPDEPVVRDFSYLFLSNLFILSWQTKTFHITFNTIPTCLPMVSVLSNSFCFCNCTTFDLISIILAFSMSFLLSIVDVAVGSTCLTTCVCLCVWSHANCEIGSCTFTSKFMARGKTSTAMALPSGTQNTGWNLVPVHIAFYRHLFRLIFS